MLKSLELDAIDWKILGELQADGSLTNVELARRVGLTPPPCLRRVHALREAGFIRGYRAMLDAPQLGFSVVCFAFVHLASQAEGDLAAFAERIRLWPSIRECWTLSGDIDFLLKCVTKDLPSLQVLVGDLTATPNVRNVRTALALGKLKDEGLVPVPGLPR
ncbi:Lrp/AsnC family transcriptional regulator [Rhabdaerophilum sp. SD176]|jgi:DNA-binding Lrp family transcriptional regulator|uniref:Lrp/AsnC family transcriptional regulator n=1 Tax=Rhabdaerophilum sp. SD176 TaxID=2983548 RepID=UPI0022C85E49|nr:Lrp/AsnC family transcriptional regulator [Rhabdaerophilum sp. SD176]MCZ8182944.1 Lrp/AsnC family transcriptional regulator [Beijerinckiaceae bacterium]MCZ8185531.1 Lrp/AsnC family transcriptional regulator [Beijerinckiaceae bacterium]MCZ8301100.1 Lrp/AsnC family transcriptional regulator [Beijerinckiaceae bacterium]